MKRLPIVASLFAVLTGTAAADCSGRLVRVDSLDDALDYKVVIQTSDRKNFYAVDGECLTRVPSGLFRRSARGATALLYFRAPESSDAFVPYFTKHVRLYDRTSAPTFEVKLDRQTDHWLRQTSSNGFAAVESSLADTPVTGVDRDTWSRLHLDETAGPDRVNSEIRKEFHVFWRRAPGSEVEMGANSLTNRPFWSLEGDRNSGVIAKFGIHAFTNSDNDRSDWTRPINIGSMAGVDKLVVETWSPESSLVNRVRLEF